VYLSIARVSDFESYLFEFHSLAAEKEESHGKTGWKIALITAADQGIGRATALRFADEGASDSLGNGHYGPRPRRSTIGESCHPDAHSRCIGF
jgi:hypothetical protein